MSTEIFPERIDVGPTGRCNLDCPVCFSPFIYDVDEQSVGEWCKEIDYLSKIGLKKIVFTGGESLLRKGIDNMLSYSKRMGLIVTLSTNGIYLKDHLSAIIENVDNLGIPIDGSTPEKNALMRIGNPKQFNLALEAIKMVKEAKPGICVTVRTVVTQINSDDIGDIGRLLSDMPDGYIDKWKIYQCLPPSGEKMLNWDNLRVSDEKFKEIVTHVRDLFPSLNIVSQDMASQIKNGGYVFVRPNGDIENVFTGNIGNPLKEKEEMFLGKVKQLSSFFPHPTL